MLVEPLPSHISPVKMAEQELSLEGLLEPRHYDRLADKLFDNVGDINAKLSFSVDKEGFRIVTGLATTTIDMQCQRCLDIVSIPLDVSFTLAIVSSDEAAAEVPSHYDPYWLQQERVALCDIIEEELILALPTIPMHEQCSSAQSQKQQDIGKQDDGSVVKDDNPFAVLASLKQNSKIDE